MQVAGRIEKTKGTTILKPINLFASRNTDQRYTAIIPTISNPDIQTPNLLSAHLNYNLMYAHHL